MAEIELADYIEGLRHELELAVKRGGEQAVRFLLEKVDLEVAVAITTEGEVKGGAKFKFWVVDAEAGAKANVGRKTTQTIKLSLKPTQGGKDLLVSSEDRPGSR